MVRPRLGCALAKELSVLSSPGLETISTQVTRACGDQPFDDSDAMVQPGLVLAGRDGADDGAGRQQWIERGLHGPEVAVEHGVEERRFPVPEPRVAVHDERRLAVTKQASPVQRLQRGPDDRSDIARPPGVGPGPAVFGRGAAPDRWDAPRQPARERDGDQASGETRQEIGAPARLRAPDFAPRADLSSNPAAPKPTRQMTYEPVRTLSK